MCFNKKVLGGLAVLGLGIVEVTPHVVASVLPLLLVAACPLSMLFMGKAMMGGQRTPQAEDTVPHGDAAALSRAEQVSLLRAQLQSVTAQQAVLAQQLEAVYAAEATIPTKVLQEAEQVAVVAAERPNVLAAQGNRS